MKQHLVILFITAAFISMGAIAQTKVVKTSNANKIKKNTDREDRFAAAVMQALQSNNTETWIALYPTNEEYKDILQAGLAAKAEGLTQQIIDDIIVRRKKEAAAVYAKQFGQYRSVADSLGFSWQDAVFEKFIFTDIYPKPVKLKYLGGSIRFSSNKKHFVIDGIQAVDIASGYKLQALSEIRMAAADE